MNKKIEKFIEQFSQSWMFGDLEKTGDLLSENVVFLAPDLKTEIGGRAKCLQSFAEYLEKAKTKTFEVSNKKIHVWGNTSTVVIDYYVEYELGGQDYKENGTEFWTLQKQKGEWKLVWRALVSSG